MKANGTIIDVTPIEYSSSKGASSASRASGAYGASRASRSNSTYGYAQASSRSAQYQQPTWRTASSFHDNMANPNQVHYGSAYTRFGDQTVISQVGNSAIGGMVQMAVGTGLVLIGVPMLILPGPGLLSIVGGMALIANGMRKVFGLR